MASFCVFLVLLACVSSCFGQDPSCSTVKTAYRSKRLTEGDVPSSAVDGNDLRVCPKDNGKQCCSQRMEDRFAGLARGDFDEAVTAKVGEIKGLFNEQAKILDGYFRGLIKKSQQDLDSMYKKIYGYHYEQNTKIFMDLFVDLTNYYNGATSSDVNSIMDKFFTSLMSRMFQIMNDKHQFSVSYLSCVSKHMEKLQPFGDVPEKLKPQVRKVLLHARTFSQALHAGRDVAHMLGNAVSSSSDCENNLVKLKYCSWCKAMTTVKPCFKFCSDVHRSCLSDVTKVNTQWQTYMMALNDVLEKQTGPTNIQDVILGLNLKISFAIMNFQNAKKMADVKEKVFQARECGSPGLTKRSTDDFFLEGSNRQRRDSDAVLARTSSQFNLDKLSTNFKGKMKVADNFWSALPEKVCYEVSVKDKNSDCWNGVGKGSYTSPNDGGNNIEDDLKPAVQQAIDRLKEVVFQLNAALNGDEIITTGSGDDEDDSGSGSGSGSGVSGDNEITEDPEEMTTGPDNEIDDDVSETDGVKPRGVNRSNHRERGNSASCNHLEVLLVISSMFAFLVTLTRP